MKFLKFAFEINRPLVDTMKLWRILSLGMEIRKDWKAADFASVQFVCNRVSPRFIAEIFSSLSGKIIGKSLSFRKNILFVLLKIANDFSELHIFSLVHFEFCNTILFIHAIANMSGGWRDATTLENVLSFIRLECLESSGLKRYATLNLTWKKTTRFELVANMNVLREIPR